MPELRPLRGIRYATRAGELADLLAPPYDIVDDEQFTALCGRSPCNVVRLTLDRGYSRDRNPSDDWYGQTGELCRKWRAEGILAPDPEPCFYLYTQSFEHAGSRLRRKLLFGALRLAEYGKGHVHPHENTTPGPKAGRLRLIQATHANLSPILAFFPDAEGRINARMDALEADPPRASFTDAEGIGHELRLVADTATQDVLAAALAPLPLYIADGHHRYETALNYRAQIRAENETTDDLPCDFVLAACMSGADPGLVIRPTHRLVAWDDAQGFDDLLAAAERWFTIERLPAAPLPQALAALAARQRGVAFLLYGGPAHGYAFVRLIDGDALWGAELPSGSPVRRLASGVFRQAFLHKILGRMNPTVLYHADPARVVHGVDNAHGRLACLLPSVRPAQLMAIVDAGERMPPKSTYFWPKPLTGMVLRSLDEF